MKKITLFLLLTLLVSSCNRKSELEREIEKIPVEVTVERFDKAYYEYEDLQSVKQKFPHFFPADVPDSVWIAKKQDTIYQELYEEVQKKFSDISPLQKQLTSLFQHIKYYYPNEKIPTFYTVISEVDYHRKTFYTDSIAWISLDVFLGKDHHFYAAEPEYLRENLEPEQILPNLVQSFAHRKIPYPRTGDFLSRIIYEGKILYLKDLLLPGLTDAQKIAYPEKKLKWAVTNEENVWRYFIDEKMLYSTDPSLVIRFVNEAPFSKFYLDIDSESPGKIGSWVGWQIVRSYAKNNAVSLEELLHKNAEEIFRQSKYKPRK